MKKKFNNKVKADFIAFMENMLSEQTVDLLNSGKYTIEDIVSYEKKKNAKRVNVNITDKKQKVKIGIQVQEVYSENRDKEVNKYREFLYTRNFTRAVLFMLFKRLYNIITTHMATGRSISSLIEKALVNLDGLKDYAVRYDKDHNPVSLTKKELMKVCCKYSSRFSIVPMEYRSLNESDRAKADVIINELINTCFDLEKIKPVLEQIIKQDETNNVDDDIRTMYDDILTKNARNSFYGVYRNRYDNDLYNPDIRHPLHPYLDTESLTNIREHVLEKIIRPINHDSRFEPTEDLVKELVYLYSVCVLPNEFVYDKEHDFMYLGTIDSRKTYHMLDLIGNVIYKNVIDVNTKNDLISRTGYIRNNKWLVFWYKGSTIYVSEDKITLNFNCYLDVIKYYINNGDKRVRDNLIIREKYNPVELLIDTTNMEVNYKESFVSIIDTYKRWYKQINQKELELTKDPYLVVIKDFIK